MAAPGTEAACASACEDRGSKWRAYYRKDVVDSVSGCFDAMACGPAFEEKGRRSACWDTARGTPTVKAEEVCARLIERFDDCGHFRSKEPYDTNRCLRSVGLLDEPTLQAIGECTTLTCRNWKKYSPWDCIHDVAGTDTMP